MNNDFDIWKDGEQVQRLPKNIGTPEQRNESQFGLINPYMNCPHCNTLGDIRTKPIIQKMGISGGKAVAGFLTAGLSILVVGLSREETQTEARCGKCSNVWHF